MGLDIATGAVSPTPDPVHGIDASASPGVQRPGLIQPGQLDGPTEAGRDMTAEYRATMAAAEAECQAALAPGMAAEDGRRDGYQRQILPAGGSYGDLVDLPPVPDNAVPPAMSDLYPWGGLEPTPASAGYFHGGDEPLPE